MPCDNALTSQLPTLFTIYGIDLQNWQVTWTEGWGSRWQMCVELGNTLISPGGETGGYEMLLPIILPFCFLYTLHINNLVEMAFLLGTSVFTCTCR